MNEHNTQIATPPQTEDRKIRSERLQAVHTFTLARAKALNALDNDMIRTLADELPRIARNPDIYIVGLLSENPKAFCAGGDVVALTDAAKRDIEIAKRYSREEYALNWLLECFSKPTVSFIDGLCMGSGVGLTAYNTHRVAGENYKWGMPETKIGLFPDVGIAHVLARMPWPIGLYLGLTGRTIGRADAQWLSLVTHCIAASEFGGIIEKLKDAQPVDPILDGLNQMQEPGPVQKEAGLIRDHFSRASLREIVASLAKAEAAGDAWARDTLAGLRKCSPTSLAITERHIRAAREMDIRETLIADYRIAVRCLEAHDFAEGVRALLRDKDGHPHWQPAQIEEVSDEAVARYFAPLGEGELELPSRSEMQEARV